jgi:hypothetical protein
MGKAGAFHDLADGDILETMAVKQAARTVDDFLSNLGAVTGGVSHEDPP